MRSIISIVLQLSRFMFMACCLTVALFAFAKPDRPDPMKKEPMIPAIDGPSVWGMVTQDGRKIKVRGNDTWEADGEIRKDGKLFLLWILLSNGKAAPGLYEIGQDGSIVGVWNYGESVTTDEKGNLQGLTRTDTLRAAPKPDF